jgi:DNA-directed RNA polymerase specialized sigma24 family protein
MLDKQAAIHAERSTDVLSALSDEDLCRNAQNGCSTSREFLWFRYNTFIQRTVRIENKHQHLPYCEMDDVLQELYFAFHKAVDRYNPDGQCYEKPSSFKTFLAVVVKHKFSNCCALSRIYHKHVLLNFDVNVLQSHNKLPLESLRLCTPNGNGSLPEDWQRRLLNEFSSSSLIGAVKKLKPKEKRLLAIWLKCDIDKDVAQALGISPAAAKLRRERLFGRIRHNVIQK